MDERRQPMMRKRREVELRVKVNLNQEFSKKREREVMRRGGLEERI